MSSVVPKTGPWPRVWIAALYGALSYAFCSPLFAQPTGLGVYDWDQHLFYYGAVLKNVVEYGQMPFWNPWYCGGNVLWQNPQIALLSPVYPLTALHAAGAGDEDQHRAALLGWASSACTCC